MTPRSIRRAAERKALKNARKTAPLPQIPGQSPQLPNTIPAPTGSAARIAANQVNAKLSTVPHTLEGKAKSSSNAKDEATFLSEPKIQRVTALTGKTVLLPAADVDAYRKHIQNFIGHFQPVGHAESYLVQALADHDWRLDRIASLEMAIYAWGHEQFSEQFADSGELQIGFTEMHTFLHYEKQLRNLQIQEMRIRRNREKDTAELRRLQQERIRDEAQKQLEQQKNVLARRDFAGDSASIEWAAADDDKRSIGFEFSSVGEPSTYLSDASFKSPAFTR